MNAHRRKKSLQNNNELAVVEENEWQTAVQRDKVSHRVASLLKRKVETH